MRYQNCSTHAAHAEQKGQDFTAMLADSRRGEKIVLLILLAQHDTAIEVNSERNSFESRSSR